MILNFIRVLHLLIKLEEKKADIFILYCYYKFIFNNFFSF